jgi:nucleoside 2-deoxyribosyltransferase
MKHYVYLAGPITGLTYDGCTDWRDAVALQLNSSKIECLSPLRGKAFLKDEKCITESDYPNPIATSKGITRRDMFDTTRASCVFVNMLGTKRVSIGTVMEIAWAYNKQIPLVLVMEKGNMHEHAMILEAATYIVGTLEEGAKLVKFVLNDVADAHGKGLQEEG